MTTLAEIITNHNFVTDKNSLHSYCEQFYEKALTPYRYRPTEILEIGFDQGGSLMLWAEWFTNAAITGVDLQFRGNCQTDCAAYPNIQLLLGNAYDLGALQYFGNYDLIIDDGSHDPDHQVWVVKHLATRVKPGGMLIIEDISEDSTVERLKSATPFHLRDYLQVIDLRWVKGRHDDRLLVIRVPEKNTNQTALHTTTTNQLPTG